MNTTGNFQAQVQVCPRPISRSNKKDLGLSPPTTKLVLGSKSLYDFWPCSIDLGIQDDFLDYIQNDIQATRFQGVSKEDLFISNLSTTPI